MIRASVNTCGDPNWTPDPCNGTLIRQSYRSCAPSTYRAILPRFSETGSATESELLVMAAASIGCRIVRPPHRRCHTNHLQVCKSSYIGPGAYPGMLWHVPRRIAFSAKMQHSHLAVTRPRPAGVNDILLLALNLCVEHHKLLT